MKIKSKISYLGERNSFIPGQMAEKLAVEVDVKNVTYTVHSTQQQEQEQDKLHYFVWIFLQYCSKRYGLSKFCTPKYDI